MMVTSKPDARSTLDRAAEASSYLDIAGVTKQFRGLTVLDNLYLGVNQGEFVSLLGPSGCGKTTLLRLIAGLIKADAGRIILDSKNLTRLPAHRRNIGVVFQNYALFPHLTVAENIAFGLKAKQLPRAEVDRAVKQALALVRLEDYGDRPIAALSGGQQQRVAVARAIAIKPALLLLDESLSALDRKLRETMQFELRHLFRELGITAIFVTHDQDEALVMSDRIAVMNNGHIEQFSDPTIIYTQPATPYVLDFVGLATRFHGRVVAASNGRVRVETPEGTFTADGDATVGSSALIAVRPEKMEVVDTPETRHDQFNTTTLLLDDRVFLGSKTLLHFETSTGDRAIAEVSQLIGERCVPGDSVTVRWSVADTLFYPNL